MFYTISVSPVIKMRGQKRKREAETSTEEESDDTIEEGSSGSLETESSSTEDNVQHDEQKVPTAKPAGVY